MSELALTGASFHRGTSKQDYSTPRDFRKAVMTRFGVPTVDLAANADNYFGNYRATFFSEADDSLTKCWHVFADWLWLNPPFGDITPWAKKCAYESKLGAKILFLTPAAVGSNWFADYVWGKALVLALRPRLSFDGKNAYPKDVILSCYGLPAGFQLWKWK